MKKVSYLSRPRAGTISVNPVTFTPPGYVFKGTLYQQSIGEEQTPEKNTSVDTELLAPPPSQNLRNPTLQFLFSFIVSFSTETSLHPVTYHNIFYSLVDTETNYFPDHEQSRAQDHPANAHQGAPGDGK